MNVARLRVVLDGSAAGALKALAATKTATLATAKGINKTLMPALKATAAGFAALGAQATVGGIVSLTNALLPLVGLVGTLPGLLVGAGAAAGTAALALQGVGDAIKSWDDPKKFKASLDSLTPAARAFVKALKDIKDHGFEQLHLDVQQSLFAGMAKTVKELAGTYLPLVDGPLMAIAADIRRVVSELSAFLLRADTVKDITLILDEVRKGFADLGAAVVPLAQVFRDLSVVSAGFLPQLATGAVNVAEKLRDMVAAGRADGGIASFITAGIETAKQLGQVLGNVGSIIHSVFAAGGDGAGLLGGIQAATSGLATALKSVQGQDALKQFFAAAAQAGKVLMPVISAVLPIIANISQVLATLATHAAPGVVTFLTAFGKAIRTLGPAAGKLGDSLSQMFTILAPSLQPLADVFSTVVELAGKLLVDLAPLAAPLVQLAGSIGQLLLAAEPLIQALVTALVPVINQLSLALLQSQPAFTQIIDALIQMLPAFQAILEAIIPLIPVLVSALVPIFQSLADILVALTPTLQDIATWMQNNEAVMADAAYSVESLMNGFQLLIDVAIAVKDVIVTVGDAIGDFAYGVWSVIDTIGTDLGNFAYELYELPGRIIGVFSDAGSWLYDAGKSVISGFISGIWDMVTAPVNGLQSILGQITDLIPDWKGPAAVDAKLLAPAGRLVMGGFIDNINAMVPDLHRTLTGITNSIAATSVSMPAIAMAGVGLGASAASTGTVINMPMTVNVPSTWTPADSTKVVALSQSAAEATVQKLLGAGVLIRRQQMGR